MVNEKLIKQIEKKIEELEALVAKLPVDKNTSFAAHKIFSLKVWLRETVLNRLGFKR